MKCKETLCICNVFHEHTVDAISNLRLKITINTYPYRVPDNISNVWHLE